MTSFIIAKESSRSADDSVTSDGSSQGSETRDNRTYVVDRILAEQEDDEGDKFYLIKWEGYNLLESSWEPEANIYMKETFDDWESEKLRITKGLVRPFDVTKFDDDQREYREAKEARKRRDAQRKRLDLAVSSFELDKEYTISSESESNSESSVEATEVREKIEDVSISSPLRSLRRMPKLGPKTSPLRPVAAKEDEFQGKGLRKRRMRNDKVRRDDLAEATEGSSVAGIKNSPQKSRAGSGKLRTGTRRNTSKAWETVSLPASVGLSSTSLYGISPSTTPQVAIQEKPATRAEAPSRTGYQGTANRGSSSLRVLSRGRGGLAVRGVTRGSSRGGAVRTTFSFTGTNNATKETKKPSRSLANALLSAPKNDSSKPKEHFKTPSMVRKAELAARALADRAPDMAFVGPLSKPSEYGGLKPNKKRPQVTRLEDLRDSAESGLIQENSSLSSNRITVESRESIDNGDGIASPKEPSKPAAGNESVETGKEKGHFTTLNRSISPPTNSITVGSTTEIDPLSRDLPTLGSTASRELPLGHSQNMMPPNENRPPDLTRRPSEPAKVNLMAEIISEQPQLTPLREHSQTGQQYPSKPVAKMKLNEYRSRRWLENLGDAIPMQAVFGERTTQPITVAFTGIEKSSKSPWVLALKGLGTVSFSQMCTSADFQAQVRFLQGCVLAKGDCLSDPSGASILEELAEHLRPFFGVVSYHSKFAILVFPARCEEWKFLDSPDVGQNAALQYHIFESAFDYSNQPDNNKLKSPIPSIEVRDNYFKFLVEHIQDIQYRSLIPSPYVGDEDIRNFYLIFPQRAANSADFIAKWLHACNKDCRVFTNQKAGSWDIFCNGPIVKCGGIIIHHSLVPLIWRIPHMQQLINGDRPFNFWCFDDCASTALYSSPVDNKSSLVRLFPHGGAVLLTPSFLNDEPERTYTFLKWFQQRVSTATPGTWKLVLSYNCRQYLLDLAIQKADIHEDRTVCSFRFRNYRVLDELLKNHLMLGFPHCWEENVPDDFECPVIYADESIKADDEFGLLSWYAGWTMLNLNIFRKFIVIGTTSSQHNIKKNTKPSNNSETGFGRPSPKKSSSDSIPQDPENSDGKIAPNMATGRGKWNEFAEAKDPSSKTAVSGPNPAAIQHISGNMQHGSRPNHGIDATANQSILKFIAITGSDRRAAEEFLDKYNGEFDTAVRKYLSSSISPPIIEQLDGKDDTDDPIALLDFIAGTNAPQQIGHKKIHLANQDARRAIELYKEGHEVARSPSKRLFKQPIGLSGEAISVAKPSGQVPLTSHYTSDWSDKLKEGGGHWNHIYVGSWEQCFKILKISRKVK